MKKQARLIFILLTLIFSTLGFANRTLVRRANATYVEGLITRDTDWTLVDSPFILSNDVTVNSGVTLTIEPGVEVRFGGDFSLIVNGRIFANGTTDKMILFTTNDPTHNVTWRTIMFNNSQLSSLLNCIIEYGKNGTTITNGNLSIQDSLVKSSSENGIALDSGHLFAEGNMIANNTVGGLCITGGTQVVVENNTIASNTDGIELRGHLTGEIDIERNEIMLNSQNGIILNSDAYDNTSIVNNHVSSNLNGILVNTNTSTYITRNYVSDNSIGINYVQGSNHQAHFNDISGNQVGMDVASSGNTSETNVNVSATYNYWGHESGPFHQSLNPYGKGNTVGGDGVNLDFIFFLSTSIAHTNTEPIPVLWSDKIRIAPDQNVTFIGTDSFDDGRVDQYFFDFGDGNNTGWTTLTLYNHTYSQNGMYNASLRVIDDFNTTGGSVAIATVDVENGISPLDAVISLDSETVNYNEPVTVTVYVSNATDPVEGVNVTLFSIRGGNFDPVSALTNATGYFTTIFTAPNVTQITDVRMIARVSMPNYADGSAYKYLKVFPPLQVEVSTQPQIIKSEETATVAVRVTLGSEEPVTEALVIIQADSGNLSPDRGTTNVNGTTIFTFTAPQTLNHIITTITATASKTDYATGQGQATVNIEPRLLMVEAHADPLTVISESLSTISVRVTSDALTVPNATVSVSSDIGGSISPSAKATLADGSTSFDFVAPLVANIDGSVATISVTASKAGYVNGETSIGIMVIPRLLAVQVHTEPATTYSEAQINTTIHVAYAYDMSSVAGADVAISLADGENLTASGLTNTNGDVRLSFTAPPVNATTVYTLSAVASKIGYIDGQNTSTITVNPGIINIQLKPSSEIIESGGTIIIEAYVTNDANSSIANVSITMTTNYGNFTTATTLTDSEGMCSFIFNAPETSTQLPVAITANATRNGYTDGTNQTAITVTPHISAEGGGGLALTTILLIIIPIVIVVIVAVLIKLKIIAISLKEET